MKKKFIPILTQKIRVRVIHECALYLNKYGMHKTRSLVLKVSDIFHASRRHRWVINLAALVFN